LGVDPAAAQIRAPAMADTRLNTNHTAEQQP
jgi:hypothetical protein